MPVKVAVISKSERFWSTKMILKVARKAGHEPVYLRTDQIRGVNAADAIVDYAVRKAEAAPKRAA